MLENLLVRADGSPQIGTGHVMRSLALAQGWQHTGGQVVFAEAESTPSLDRRLRSEGIDLVRLETVPGSSADAAQTLAQARTHEASWIVADGYCFGAAWQKEIKDAGLRLLLVDDYGHAEHYYADLVLNQNLHADVDLYARRELHTRLLLGTRYVLLRHEFLEWRDWQRTIPPIARKVLVTFGGSDPENVTGKVVQALARLPDVEALVVVGGSNPNLDALNSAISNKQSAIRVMVDATNMPELMAWADVALTASGSTAWELAFLGLPSIVMVLAANQADVAAALEREGVSHRLEGQVVAENISAALAAELGNSACRQRMSQRGREVVDGWGVSRVVTRMHAARFTLRRAGEQDCRLIWEWANDSEVRASAFNIAPIPWETHVSWFSGKLRDAASAMFVGLNADGRAFGQVRFDWDEHRVSEVDVSVDRNQRKAGLGSALICRAVEELFATAPVDCVKAHIRPGNSASIRAFEKAGFQRAGFVTVHEHQAIRFIIMRTDGY